MPGRSRFCAVTVLVAALLLPRSAFAQSDVADVVETTGAATVRIPIVVPPGPAELTPELALVYDSTATKGGSEWLGLGWALAGLSVIERDRKLGPPFDFAGGTSSNCGGTYCYRDDFTLDGQDLIPDSTAPQGTNLYRTQADDGRRIKYLDPNDPNQGWEIRDRQGRRFVYGAAAEDATRVRAAGKNGQVFSWLLERIEDLQGNWIRFTYTPGAGVLYPLGIAWGQRDALANRKVVFVLNPSSAPRPDRAIQYSAGFRQQVDRRLVQVDVLGSGALVTRYVLAYTQAADSGRSILASLNRLGSNEITSWPAQYRFEYADSERAFASTVSSIAASQSIWQQQVYWALRMPADVDGDGFTDLLTYTTTPGKRGWILSKGPGGAAEFVELDDSRFFSESHYMDPGGTPCTHTIARLLDLDGDGLLDDSDLFLPLPAISATGCDFYTTSRSTTIAPGNPLAGDETNYTKGSTIDLTGDGRPDRIDSNGWTVHYNRRDPIDGSISFSPPISWFDPAGTHIDVGDQTAMLVEINGDGLIDRVFKVGSIWRVAYNWGAGFESIPEDLDGPNSLPPRRKDAHGELVAAVDVNGDGFTDRVEMAKFDNGTVVLGRWGVWFGNGIGFQPGPVAYSGPVNINWSYPRSSQSGRPELLDWSGDGLVDLSPSGKTDDLYLNLGPFPDLLKSVTTPLGGTTSFAYASSAQFDAQGVAMNPNHPRVHPVVARITRSTNQAGVPDVADEFTYRDGEFDRVEREFRGFGEVRRLRLEGTDPNNPGSEVVSEYDTSRACSGRLSYREVNRDGSVFSRESHMHTAVPGPSAPSGNIADTWAGCVLQQSDYEAVEGEATPSTRRIVRRYGTSGIDPLYNVSEIEEWTVLNPPSAYPDRTTHFIYAPPASSASQLVAEIAETWVTGGSDPTPLEHRRFTYDARTDGKVEAGLVTKAEAWLAQPSDPNAPSPRWVLEASIEYDQFGNPSVITGPPTDDDQDGLETTVTYDGIYETFPVSMQVGSDTATPLTTTINYSGCIGGSPPPALGLPCVTTNGLGESETLGYDALGRVVQREDQLGLVETRFYDFSVPAASTGARVRRYLQLQSPTPQTLRFATVIDALGRPLREESPGRASETVRTARTYDERGRVSSQTIPHFVGDPNNPAVPPGTLAQSFWYDALDRLVLERDHDGQTHRQFTYDPLVVTEEVFFGAPVPGSAETKQIREFNALGQLVRVDDFLDSTTYRTTAKYDAMGRLLELRDPLKNNSTLCTIWKGNYGWQGQVCSGQEKYPFSKVSWDTLGRRVRIDDMDSGVWTYQYDDAGLLKRQAQGAPTSEISSVTYEYDEIGRRIEQHVSPTGKGAEHAAFVYGPSSGNPGYGRLVAVNGAGGSSPAARYTYTYDADGRLLSTRQITDGKAFDNEYAYDELGRVVSRTFPDDVSFDYAWDGVRLASIFQPHGVNYAGWVLRSASYDALGRFTRLELGDRSGSGSSDAPVGIIDYAYDPNTARLSGLTGQMAPATTPQTVYQTAYDFDGLGRLVSRTGTHFFFEESVNETYAYDTLGRLQTAVGPWERPEGNTAPVTWTFEYDPLGNLYRQTSSNAEPNTRYERTWKYGNDSRPRFLTDFTWTEGGAVMQEQIQLGAAGRPSQRTRYVGLPQQTALFYEWGPQNRPYGAGDLAHHHHWDAFRNLVLETGATKIIHVGDDFEYYPDLSGGQANKFFFVGGQRIATLATFYTAPSAAWADWAWLLRPAERLVVPAGLAALALGLLSLALLALGVRRPWATVPGAGLLAAALIALPYRAWSGGGGGGPSPAGSHGEPILVYLPDHLGSTRAVVNVFGNLVETRDYAPFGRTTRHTGDFDLRHRFTSEPMDAEAGSYDYGARLYDPAHGRFLAPDEYVQSFDSQGINAYAYVLNCPTSYVDPTGEGAYSKFVVHTLIPRAAKLARTAGFDIAAEVAESALSPKNQLTLAYLDFIYTFVATTVLHSPLDAALLPYSYIDLQKTYFDYRDGTLDQQPVVDAIPSKALATPVHSATFSSGSGPVSRIVIDRGVATVYDSEGNAVEIGEVRVARDLNRRLGPEPHSQHESGAGTPMSQGNNATQIALFYYQFNIWLGSGFQF
jgi:RHS repeat-associated protein